MINTEIHIGLKLDFKDGISYRIIEIQDRTVRLIRLGVDKIEFKMIDKTSLAEDLIMGNINADREEQEIVVDYSNLPAKAKSSFEKYLGFINEVKLLYGPSYNMNIQKGAGNTLRDVADKHGISHATAYRIFRRWLQSGFNNFALVDSKVYRKQESDKKYTHKTGPKGKGTNIIITPDVQRNFEYGLNLLKIID